MSNGPGHASGAGSSVVRDMSITPATDAGSPGRTVSLVLSSGGARGLAHIGVIREIEARGYRIRSIAGASMGALVGGVYAAGKLDAYADWVCALSRFDVLRLLDVSWGHGGIMSGEDIIGALRELVGEHRIEDLDISFTAVAADLDSGKEVWLRSGLLFDAIRASIAVPVLFEPHLVDGLRLVDGGIVNPMPIAPTLAERSAYTVACDVNGPAESDFLVNRSEERSPSKSEHRERLDEFLARVRSVLSSGDHELSTLDVAMRSMDMMQSLVARLKMAAYSPDLLIRVPHNACAFLEFHRARELISLGRSRAAQVFDAAGLA